MTDSTNDPTNPYVGRGLILTHHEFELVSAGLTMFAEKASEQGQRDVRNDIVKFMVRLKQIEHAGEGMTPETSERFGRRIAKAMETANADALSRGVADLMAAMIRLDPDPAEKIGIMLSEMVRNGVGETARARCVEWFNQLILTIEGASAAWDTEGWPTPQQSLEWVTSVVRGGTENLEAGHEPWFDDEDGEPS